MKCARTHFGSRWLDQLEYANAAINCPVTNFQKARSECARRPVFASWRRNLA